MGSEGITSTSQPSQVTNETVKSLDVGSRHKFQSLKEAPAKGPQPTKDWAVTEEEIDSFQLLLIATYPTIFRLGSVPDPHQ